MILKLKVSMKISLNAECSNGWELISDVTSFRYSKVTKEQAENKELRVNDRNQRRDKEGKIETDVQGYVYIQAWHKRATDEPINIITNMPAYMLNDEGKTIERIN